MALISIFASSILGLVAGGLGWAMFDLGFLGGALMYLGISIGLPLVICAIVLVSRAWTHPADTALQARG